MAKEDQKAEAERKEAEESAAKSLDEPQNSESQDISQFVIVEQPAQTTTRSSNSVGNGGNADYFDTYNIPEQQNTTDAYVLNMSTLKFHRPSCKDVKRIKPENYATTSTGRNDLIAQGYSPCGHCNP